VITEQQTQEVASLKRQLEESRSAAQAKAQQEVLPADVQYDYRYKVGASGLPFNLVKIGHTNLFTYIWANPAEAFTVYEIQDGKPNLVPIKPHNGYYLIETVIQKGELKIGKRRLQFKREG
jgi:type IV secretion system protein VirB9